MTFLKNNFFKILALVLAIYLIWIISGRAIDLATADLGRHIINGRIISSAFFNEKFEIIKQLLHSNFYSYSEPQFEFHNHHWLIGVIFSELEKLVGMNGLSILNLFCILLANLIFAFTAQRLTNSNLALFSLILSIPITCMRTEVRPESLSYVFLALVFLLLTLYDQRKLSFKKLAISLSLIQVIWINLHIFYIFGLFLCVAFFLKYLIEKDQTRLKAFLYLALVLFMVSLINPSGIWGLLHPLNIFKGYGYSLAENQSVIFMQGRYPNNPQYYYFELMILINLVFYFLSFKKKNLAYLIISVVFCILALKTNRTMTLFAFSSIPILALNIKNSKMKLDRSLLILSFVLIAIFISFYQFYLSRSLTSFKFNPASHKSAQFFKAYDIKGPIFNNYDIGGYLIYHLFPYRRVFVDNRPEAYSEEFLQETYLKALEFDESWSELDSQYGFNCIYFYRHDNTEHGQPFLIKRLADRENWAPVFVDAKTIILLKRNELNKDLIEEFELPEKMFRAVKT